MRIRKNAVITAVGGYVPDTVLSNHDLEKMVDTNSEWIVSRTGIKERRIVNDPEIATSDMATFALRRLMEDGKLTDPGTGLDDLGELPFARTASVAEPAVEIPELPEEEATVFEAVTTDESAVDRIIERSGLPAHVVTATLMKLEMRRLVRAFPGFRYARR